MLNREIPFLRIIIPLCAGVISGLYLNPDNWVIFTVILSCISLFFFSIRFNKSPANNLFGISFFIALMVSGFLLYKIEKKNISILDQEKSDITVTVTDFPEERENSYRARLKLNSVITNGIPVSAGGHIMLYFKKDSALSGILPGDILKIRCTPQEILNRGNPCEFDYRFYLENQGVRYMAFASKKDIIAHIVPLKRSLKYKALIIREKIIDMYRNRGITGRNLALVAAMTVGEKALLEQDQKDIFIRAGIMHIMAVSGLHAIVLSMFVFNMLFFLKRRFNILRIIIAMIVLWGFAFITGLTPSVMRATLMFSFIQAGTLLKRPANSMNSVLASAFVLIINRPSVIFDAGFLLSYSAVIFIIAFYTDLYYKLHFKRFFADKLWQSAAVTIVAQAGTLSLTIMLFNRFPAYFLITNIIIVPLSSLVIIAGSILPVLYPVIFLSRFLAYILNALTSLTEYLTEKAASLPGSSIEELGMTLPEGIILTSIIALSLTAIVKKEFRSQNILLVLILSLVIISTQRIIKTERSNELIVYNVPGATVTGIRTGRTLKLISPEKEIKTEVMRHCSTLGIRIERIKAGNGPVCLMAGTKKILIAGEINSAILRATTPDIIILSGSKPVIKDLSVPAKLPEIIITSSEVISGFKLPDHLSSQLKQPVHSIRKSGAFLMDLI
ncbi:MAG: ComEC/Rec2 family competence protein [Bacteroidetes bacterium]|nr:ComEC/Rec2 family competence protein [Bacteroidota bacterium]